VKKYIALFVLMVVGNYVTAVLNSGDSLAWKFGGAVSIAAIWHAIVEAVYQIEARKTKV